MEHIRMGTPLRVGQRYRNGMSTYLVDAVGPGYALAHRPSDGWTLMAHGPALYNTPDGMQLQWDYSTDGRFDPSKIER